MEVVLKKYKKIVPDIDAIHLTSEFIKNYDENGSNAIDGLNKERIGSYSTSPELLYYKGEIVTKGSWLVIDNEISFITSDILFRRYYSEVVKKNEDKDGLKQAKKLKDEAKGLIKELDVLQTENVKLLKEVEILNEENKKLVEKFATKTTTQTKGRGKNGKATKKN